MSAELRIDTRALQQALAEMGETFRAQTLVPLVREIADGMAAEVRAGYPRGKTGNLIKGVVIERDPDGLGARVRSKAPHAWVYDHGSMARFTHGTGAARGQMPEPANPVFKGAAHRWRQRLFQRAAQALQGLRLRRAA